VLSVALQLVSDRHEAGLNAWLQLTKDRHSAGNYILDVEADMTESEKRQAGAIEIEVTPEMIEAGAKILASWELYEPTNGDRRRASGLLETMLLAGGYAVQVPQQSPQVSGTASPLI
jgi:hypothetical protein